MVRLRSTKHKQYSVGCAVLCFLIGSVLVPMSAIANDGGSITKFARLFTTFGERKQLNLARKRYLRGLDSGQVLVEQDTNPSTLREIQFDGLVLREDGRYQVWVNGSDIASGQDSRFRPEIMGDRSIRLTVAENQKIRLYPGQVYRFEDGLIQEAYQVAKNLIEDFISDELDEEELPEEEEEGAKEEQKPLEFDEAELTKQITRIRLLEDRIEELEKERTEVE